MKILRFFCLTIFCSLLFFFTNISSAFASNNSFVTVVNPVRGNEFWDSTSQKPVDGVIEEMAVARQFNVPITWLIRFDALTDRDLVNIIKSSPAGDEKGLFLEVTPSWSNQAGVKYQQTGSWHSAGSVFLTGYSITDREKLIDTIFESFKTNFGFYPKSVGSWYIDSYSLEYMQRKYGISGALIVADQYTTDNYQIWGQYWGAPFYPAKNNTLIPAQNTDEKLSLVITQWAARDPVNGYGDGVSESTYSVQANDYLDYHSLDNNYFSKLVDIFTIQPFNQINQLTVGLENSYSWKKYGTEYKKQIETLAQKRQTGQFSIVTMNNFSTLYQKKFPDISPGSVILAKDPLGSDKQTVWFMNPYYRAGWFYNNTGSVFRDIRQYIPGTQEPCYKTVCKEINFATFSTRVLDDVTYKQRLVVDMGKINNLKVVKAGENLSISYMNEAARQRKIELMPRDISLDGKVNTIDGLILNTISKQSNTNNEKINPTSDKAYLYKDNILGFLIKTLKFALFIILVLFIPGYLFLNSLKEESPLLKTFISVCIGFTLLTIVSLVGGLFKAPLIIYIFPLICAVIFIHKRLYKDFDFKLINLKFTKISLVIPAIIIGGTVFQSLLMFRSGMVYDFGIGFWGPTGHDGIWHQALVNQLIKQVPPNNPAFSGIVLSNYHYFYDLLVASAFNLSRIPVLDLIYRFFPVLFSVSLGIGTYLLVIKVLNNRAAAGLSLFFVYFGSSFGWVVSLLKKQPVGGESAFWSNQPVSMNLNPPFVISLIMIIAVILLLNCYIKKRSLVVVVALILLTGSLIEYKVYAGIILLGGLFMCNLQNILLKRDFTYLKILSGSTILALAIFLPQNSKSSELLAFSPFWFIHSMIDFSDRVGWEKLSSARQAYLMRGEWLKYLLTEIIGFLLFVVGNLGTRFIAFFSIIVFVRKKLWTNPLISLIFWMSLIAFVIPLLFVQKGNQWNIIQFFYYFLYFVAIFSGGALVFIYKKFPKYLNLFVVLVIMLITPISSVTTFRSAFYKEPPSRLTIGELEALTFLKDLPDGVILTYPFDKNLRNKYDEPFPLFVYETTSYVSAFSGKTTFIEDEMQQEILQNDFKKRLISSTEFFRSDNINWSKEFLSSNKISYIFLPAIYGHSIPSQDLNLKTIFKNDTVEVYQVYN